MKDTPQNRQRRHRIPGLSTPSRRSARAAACSGHPWTLDLLTPLQRNRSGPCLALGILLGLHTPPRWPCRPTYCQPGISRRLLSHPRPRRQRGMSRGPLVPPPHRRACCGDHECKHLSHNTRGVHRAHHGVHPPMEEEMLDVVSSSQAAPLAAADGPGLCPTSSLSRHCPHRAGVPTSIALASSTCMRRRRCLPCTGDLAPVALGYL